MKLTVDRIAKEEKCVERARKRVHSWKKWGNWMAVFCLIVSLITIAAGGFFIWFLLHMNGVFPQPQQVQNAQQQATALGMLFGFISGAMFFKGALYLAHSMKFFRGDLDDQLLVEYHDAVVKLLSES
jgi:uncharacterized membrane protein